MSLNFADRQFQILCFWIRTSCPTRLDSLSETFAILQIKRIFPSSWFLWSWTIRAYLYRKTECWTFVRVIMKLNSVLSTFQEDLQPLIMLITYWIQAWNFLIPNKISHLKPKFFTSLHLIPQLWRFKKGTSMFRTKWDGICIEILNHKSEPLRSVVCKLRVRIEKFEYDWKWRLVRSIEILSTYLNCSDVAF